MLYKYKDTETLSQKEIEIMRQSAEKIPAILFKSAIGLQAYHLLESVLEYGEFNEVGELEYFNEGDRLEGSAAEFYMSELDGTECVYCLVPESPPDLLIESNVVAEYTLILPGFGKYYIYVAPPLQWQVALEVTLYGQPFLLPPESVAVLGLEPGTYEVRTKELLSFDRVVEAADADEAVVVARQAADRELSDREGDRVYRTISVKSVLEFS